MSQSSHPPGTSPPGSGGKHRCNHKLRDRPPLGERTDELLPRVLAYYTRLCALPRRTRRALVRQWRRSLSAIALLLALGQAPALAATIAVAPGIPPDINADGLCALIEAIGNANADAQTHTDCVAGNGADTIVLPTGSTQSLTSADNSTLGPTGLPLITSTVTIQGRNSTIQRESDAPAFRILAVASSGDVTLDSTTVSGGITAYTPGGGVHNSGILTLTNSTVSGNSSAGAGGVSNSGTTTLTHSTVSGNSSDFGAGGVSNSGTATLTYSTVSGNSGGSDGYGVGGVSNTGTLTLTNSTVSGNSSSACSTCFGAGGVSNSGTATLTNSTVSGNSGRFGSSGGGVNNAGTLTLTRALISGNYGLYAGYSFPSEVGMTGSQATIVANNYNLFGHDGNAGVGFSPGPTDLVPSEGLGAILNTTLANNGGPTRTHALVAGSPALDASPVDADCQPTDQRGAFRPQGPACDIGAFEAGVEPDPFASPTPSTGCSVNGVVGQLCWGTAGPDRILGTTGNDVILGLTGDDYLNGNRGDDRLFGEEDNDRLIGGNGGDQLYGQTGDDDLRGRVGNDLLEGGDGNDRLKGHEGDDQLRGGDGDDALRGLAGHDTLEGGAGSDLLRGGGDPDTLNGGPGADTLNGGGGFDVCTSDAEDNLIVLCE